MTTEKRLNAQQDKFALYMAMGFPQVQAYVKAGYSPSSAENNAYRLMERDGIKKAIEQHKQVLAERTQGRVTITPEWIAERLAMEASGEGPDTSSPARTQALRTLADIHGLLGGGKVDLPDSARALMEALGRGLAQGRQVQKPNTVTAEVRVLPEPEGSKGSSS